MITVNLTVECTDEEQAHYFEAFVADQVTLKDYKVVTDTSEMYKNDSFFRQISKSLKKARQVRNDYINNHNARYSK